MASCVRRHPCTAFNYHIMNKTCILMPEVKCMTPSSLNNPGYLFVHLQACTSQPVWFSVRPADHGWHWVTTDDPSHNVAIVNVPGSTTRQVSRTLYRGYYLPGWRRDHEDGFRALDPATLKVTKCPNGEFLAFLNSSSYQWIPYTAGYSLPICALPMSLLPNGTPLYIVYHHLVSLHGHPVRFTGFYNHATNSTYFVNSGVYNFTAVDILCAANN